MAEPASKLPDKTLTRAREVHPFQTLRQEVDRLFEDFAPGFWRRPLRRWAFDVEPFFRQEISWGTTPAVDIVEKEASFEISAELPGMTESDIEIKLANDALTIRGEKKTENEEKKKDYYLSERRYGVFERHFHVPEHVDAEKITANFKDGVLTVTLPKTPSAQSAEKKISIKAG